MATAHISRRPSAAAAALSSAVLLVILIATASPPAGASQLNLYKGKWCSGSVTVCWDRQCCKIPSDAVSYRFYYNPDWKGYLFNDTDCSGSSTTVLDSNVSCEQGVEFKSAKLTDSSFIREVTASEEES